MNKQPERPDIKILETPDIALAKTITKMTINDETIELLGNLNDENDVARLALLISLGNDEDLKMSWTKDYAHTELRLTDSLRTKAGGIRSEQLVRITKQPDMLAPQQEGIISRIGNRIRGR